MSDFFSNKSFSFYFLFIIIIISLGTLVTYSFWSYTNDITNYVVLITLICGVIIDINLLFRHNEILFVIATALYSIATITLLSSSVGSFVDAYQGIVMFGDASLVGMTIILCSCMFMCSIFSIILSFTNFRKTT
ncbi:MAG: hypothetical protein ACK5LY_07545 [Lachnospirales bacterium]